MLSICNLFVSCFVKQSRFQMVQGDIVEPLDSDVEDIVQNRNQEEMLKNLTTFKLTLEEDEKESRSKLYLPYFKYGTSDHVNLTHMYEKYSDFNYCSDFYCSAQKTHVEDPEALDDYDDEEDEEV
jgi:hypothetical protein